MIVKLLIPMMLIFTGCANVAELRAQGKAHSIEVYSGGQKVGEWVSKGAVRNEGDSDGWYFMDSKENKIVKVSGSVIIRTL